VGVVCSQQAGSELPIERVLTVPGETSTAASQGIADAIQQRIGERFSGVRVHVHIEPAAAQTGR
jgi:divalent metal cation (Fe/Co/Zn/Cd) transporter